MNSPVVTPESVRAFLLTRYADPIRGAGKDPAQIPDNFDFLMEGVIDSLGILEMVSAVEKEFGLKLDMEALDAEEMTILGPFVRYVAAQAAKA